MKLLKQPLGYLSAAILAACVAGCTDADSLTGGQETITITADMERLPASRSQIDAESEEGTTGILWSVGDQIGVFGSSTVNAAFTGNHAEAAATASFTGNMATDDTPLYAYYPYRGEAADQTQVPVTVNAEQVWSDLASISANDIKASARPTQVEGAWHFTFQPMVALLRFEVDASGVEGVSTEEKLVGIRVEEPEGDAGTAAPWTGVFTMNLTDLAAGLTPAEGEAVTGLALTLANRPVLTEKVVAYACIAPAIKSGQTLQIYLETDKHWIGFQVKAQQDLKAGGCYDIPLRIAAATAADNDLTIEEISGEAPAMTSFSFTAAANEGKILSREAYYNGSKTTVRSVSEQKLSITEGSVQGEVSGCIPYLYDFTLVPTFTVSEGATVTVDGVEQVSGVTARNFSSPVTYTVTSGHRSRKYVVSVTNTGLPVVVLTGNSGGSVSFLDMKVPAKTTDFTENDVISIYQDGTAVLDGKACGFRLRGNSTSNFPKKPFAVKLVSKAEVLGMPMHKRWCLLANWIDRSLMRNGVAFDIAHKIQNAFSGEEAGLAWNPSGKSVELVMNGMHVGNYFLCEQIKIDENRLNIQDGFEDVKSPTTDNCGYLLEFDDNYDETNKFLTSRCNLPCMSKDVITDDAIWSYVKNWVQDIEDNLWDGKYTAAYEKLDINSVADYWIVQELTMNNEYRHPKSVYMYKNGAGKLCAGPVWDYDYQTFPNIENINAINSSYGKASLKFNVNTLLYTQSSYNSNPGSSVDENDAPYMWYPLLFKDATFKALVKSRWQTLYPILQGVTATIDRLGQTNKISDTYNQQMWPIESGERKSHGWFIDFSGDERLTYDATIENLKTVYTKRLEAMNTLINAW